MIVGDIVLDSDASRVSKSAYTQVEVPEIVALLPPIDFPHIYRQLLYIWDIGIENIPSWDAIDCYTKPYNTWYFLPGGSLPTATFLGIKQLCKPQPPFTRSFDDDCVLYTVLFVTDDMHKIICVHTATKSRTNVFCLLEYHPELCKLTDIPSPIPGGFNNRIGELKCEKMSIPSSINHMSISKSFCRLDQRISFYDFAPMDNVLQSKLEDILSPLKVEMDGVNASIVDTSIGQFYCKGAYLRLKAMWTAMINESVKCGFPLCDSMLVSLWLYAHGCPLHIHDEDILLQHISDIVQTFDMDDIPAQSFVIAMEEAGFRRPFARMMAKFLSCKTAGFDFMDIIQGIATPLSCNSYLCKLDNEIVYYRSRIASSPGNLLVAEPEKQCFVSIANGDINIPLIARCFQPGINWMHKDFARHTYNAIMELLTSNANHSVLGHVTSEQNIVNMCSHDEDDKRPYWKKMRGMSVLAGYRNTSSCGNGMYFFRMSIIGNFEDLSVPENAVVDTPTYYEFQGFMYALTRAFNNSTRDYHLAPAVLLSIVPKDICFRNAYSEKLPLLHEKCTCPSRFLPLSLDRRDEEFQLAGGDEVEVSVGEAAAIVSSLLDGDPERLNAAALRLGLVDLETVGAFEAFVSDGTIMANLKIDIRSEVSKARSPSSLFEQLGFDIGINQWRRQMYAFDMDGNICNAIVDAEVLKDISPTQYLPREFVITSQQKLWDIFSHSHMYAVFVDSSSKIEKILTSQSSLPQSYPDKLLPNFVKRNSKHPYHDGQRKCVESSCSRPDIK